MPRIVLSKKVPRKQWDKENMASPIEALRSKEMGLKKASKIFSVSRPTLQRLARLEKPPLEAASTKLGRRPVMIHELEKELVEYLLIMKSKFYGLTRQDVRRLAYQLCIKNNIDHPFSEEGLVGRAWFDHFMNRHKMALSIYLYLKKKQKVFRKGPKPSKSALITSAPYKDILLGQQIKKERSIQQNETKQQKKNQTERKKKTKPKRPKKNPKIES